MKWGGGRGEGLRFVQDARRRKSVKRKQWTWAFELNGKRGGGLRRGTTLE